MIESAWKEIKRPLWRRLCGGVLALYWIALFVSTHMPMPALDKLPKNSDKGLHLVAYAGLSFLIGLWLLTRGRRGVRLYATVIVFSIGYAILEELTQIPIANRTADPYDVLADAIGTLIGTAALFFVCQVLAARSKK